MVLGGGFFVVFLVVLEFWTQGFVLAKQVLYRLSYASSLGGGILGR